MTGRSRDQGYAARRMTLAQRRVLLERIRRDVEGVVEDIQAAAASLEAVGGESREARPSDRAMMQLIWDEQQRQQLELLRLYGEYRSLTFQRRAGKTPVESLQAVVAAA